MAELRPSDHLARQEARRLYPSSRYLVTYSLFLGLGWFVVHDTKTGKRVATIFASSDEERE